MQNIVLTPTQRMNQALMEKHIQKKTLADKINVPATTLNSWINRGGDIPSSYIIPAAEALGVHPLWLLTGEDHIAPKIPDNYMELSDDELFLLQTFRALDQAGRIVVANKAVEELRRLKADQGIAPTANGATA